LLARDTLILSGASGAVVRVIHDAGGGPQVNLGDLDGDGLDELAVADLIAEQGQGHTGVVRIFRCVDGTLLRVHRPFGPFGAFGAALAAGDIDRDGVLDLIVGQSILEAVVFTGRRGAVLGYSGAHAGLIFQHLGPPFPVTKAEFGNSIAFLGDANGDGVCSLVATGLFPTGLFSAFGLGLSCR
jgi:hypothetical protein